MAAPANATTGTSFNFTVKALDQFNNAPTSYSGTVHFSSSDATATLPGDSTLSGGTGTFSATLRALGNQTITATDSKAGITGVSAAIAVAASPWNGYASNPQHTALSA